MKRSLKKTIIITLLVVMLPLPSFALLRVGASTTVSYTHSGLESVDKFDESSQLGIGLNLVIPLGIMFRLDQYMIDLTKDEAAFDISSTVFSMGYRADLFAFHVAGAIGAGTTSISHEVAGIDSYKIKPLTQGYLEVGYNAFALFDIFLGYHIISTSEIKEKADNGDERDLPSKLNASAISLGVNFGF